jgi:hypothetical protein
VQYFVHLDCSFVEETFQNQTVHPVEGMAFLIIYVVLQHSLLYLQ